MLGRLNETATETAANIDVIRKIIFILLLKSPVILHRHKKDSDTYPKKFKILREETYGISKVIIGN